MIVYMQKHAKLINSFIVAVVVVIPIVSVVHVCFFSWNEVETNYSQTCNARVERAVQMFVRVI